MTQPDTATQHIQVPIINCPGYQEWIHPWLMETKWVETVHETTPCPSSSSPSSAIHPSTRYTVESKEHHYRLRTDCRVPDRLGLLLVGWGGNNGSTVTAAQLANLESLSWRTKEGLQKADYWGSMVMASTMKIGVDKQSGQDVHLPVNQLLPMVHPNNLVLGGWDICSDNLAVAMEKARVLEPDLQRQVYAHMERMVPWPSVYDPAFIAANQQDRANNLIEGTRWEQMQRIRANIREFKAAQQLDKCIVVWTATTERFSEILPGIHDDADGLLRAIEENHTEIAPSVLFAVACILEKTAFINGSPQNTLLPAITQLADRHGVFVAGDDFKSGQTKLKSVLADFLVGAGIKPLAITSYNHLGNNDGRNLSAPPQFRSKEISKTNVVDDVVSTNSILYGPGEHPDHTVVIKYVPSVGDSKRALDEYYSQIFMGGRNTLAIHNTCEDSLLAAPLIFDLAILTELMQRIRYKVVQVADTPHTDEVQEPNLPGEVDKDGFRPFRSVLGILGYFLKAPVFPEGAPVVHALFKQRQMLEMLLKACLGLSGSDSGLRFMAPPGLTRSTVK